MHGKSSENHFVTFRLHSTRGQALVIASPFIRWRIMLRLSFAIQHNETFIVGTASLNKTKTNNESVMQTCSVMASGGSVNGRYY
jgi:hypothetical protein